MVGMVIVGQMRQDDIGPFAADELDGFYPNLGAIEQKAVALVEAVVFGFDEAGCFRRFRLARRCRRLHVHPYAAHSSRGYRGDHDPVALFAE
jgi:hypothetical protein